MGYESILESTLLIVDIKDKVMIFISLFQFINFGWGQNCSEIFPRITENEGQHFSALRLSPVGDENGMNLSKFPIKIESMCVKHLELLVCIKFYVK